MSASPYHSLVADNDPHVSTELARTDSPTVSITNAPAQSVPWGDWLAALLAWSRDAAVLLAGALVARYAPPSLRSYLTEQVIGRAVDYAFGAVEGAAKGQALTLPQANGVILAAEKYVLANALPIAKWAGTFLRPRIIAKLSGMGSLPAEANADNLIGGTAIPGITKVA